MSTAIQLCSRALVMIGANPITALDGTDTSTEATVAIQIYEAAVLDLISRSRWRFAAKQVLLTLTSGNPVARWDATFVLPDEVLVIHGVTIDGKKVDFDRYGDLLGANCLITDAPVLDYGYRAAESTWPSYFDSYVELHLAAIFAYAIANQLDLSDFLEKKAARAFAFAKNQDGQGRTTRKLETSRFLQARGFSTGADDGYGSSSGGGGDAGLLRAGILDGTLPGSGSPIPLTNGGTGATSASTARTSLGLGTMATQAASAVAITGGTMSGVTATITAGTITGITDLAIADGGTGASTAPNARTNLGLGTISTQDASAVAITGGSITGITDLAVADGGTGASSAPTARTNLGLGTISTQDASAVAVTGGTINGTTVGATTASTGAFTTVTATTSMTIAGSAVATAADITALGVTGKNHIINSNMETIQRASTATVTAGTTVPTASTGYPCCDRWFVYSTGANVTAAQDFVFSASVADGTGPKRTLKVTGAASVTAIGIGQRIEQKNMLDMQGRTCVLSAYISNSLLTTVTWTASYANTTNTFGTIGTPTKTQIATGTFTVTSSLVRYEASFSVPATVTSGIEILFTVGAQTSGTFQLSNVQFETGAVATAFEVLAYGTQLSLCQRHYQTLSSILFANYATTGSSNYHTIIYPVPLFTAPTLVYSNFSNLNSGNAFNNTSQNFGFTTGNTITSTGSGYSYYTITASAEIP